MHTNNSEFYANLCKENLKEFGEGTNHLKMLSEQLYADNSHFLFEILQNAEDAGATAIAFCLGIDVLNIWHNGRIFSENDVRAVTQFAQSTKNDFTKIGKFGLGFKSVHAITDAPEIHSDKFHFRIKNYIRPEEAEPQTTINGWTTYFALPFKKGKAESIHTQLAKRLQNFDTRCLLFLKNLQQIFYVIGNDEGTYTKQTKTLPNGLLQISLTGKEQQNFILFNKETGQQKIGIAFACTDSDKGGAIEKTPNTELFVWFPTKMKTDLHFLINGNFVTTASRESIPENDEHNKALIELAAELLAESLPQIKKANLCNLSFLQTLPIEAENFSESNFFYPLFAKVQEILTQDAYLPTVAQGFTSAGKAVIARSAELTRLYKPEGKIWLSTAITRDRIPVLLKYLEESLEIEVITPEDFARRIDERFLRQQTDEWFIQFYQFLNGQSALWSVRKVYSRGAYRQEVGILRNKPIILLSDGTLSLPENAFLPVESLTPYPMVKKRLAEDAEALRFLEALGLREPNETDYIARTILPKYRQSPTVTDEEYTRDIKQILAVLNGKSLDASSKLRELLSGLRIIKCEDGIFRESGEVYSSSTLLKSWFRYSSNIIFADKILSEDEQIKLGVLNLPGTLNDPIVHGRQYKGLAVIEGTAEFLGGLNSGNILTLKDILLQFNTKYPSLFTSDQINLNEKTYNNLFKGYLLRSQWVLGKDGQFYKPADIMKEDIADSIKEVANLPFEFKTNREKELEEELAKQGKKIVDQTEYNEFEVWKRQQATAKQQEEADWFPEVKPEQAKLRKSLIDTIPGHQSNPRIKAAGTDNDEVISTPEYSPNIPESSNYSPKKAKAIGQWSEEAIKKFLMAEEGYQENEVKILNENGNVGTGRDIEVRRNGKLEKIIEVKSTESITDHAFKVSGHQWETARKEDDLYWIYVLFGAGSRNPEIVRIQNPIKKWKDGELQADPVNFIIRKK